MTSPAVSNIALNFGSVDVTTQVIDDFREISCSSCACDEEDRVQHRVISQQVVALHPPLHPPFLIEL
jgi:hypothetical protein